MMTMGSLFSGIGGLELGLEWAGLGPTLWQVERESFCRAVLEKHWPLVERFDDVCKVDGTTLAHVDLICGGFPCQDTSGAGKGAGLQGARSGLWFEMARVIGELRPLWVVIENPTSGASRWVDTVRGNLGELGYASLPVPVHASWLGAAHRRARTFIVANLDGERQRNVHRQRQECAGRPGASSDVNSDRLRLEPGRHGRALRNRAHVARLEARGKAWPWAISNVDPLVYGSTGRLVERERRALGNACAPQQAEVVGWVIRELMAERGAA